MLVIISFSLLTSLGYAALNWMKNIPGLGVFTGGFLNHIFEGPNAGAVELGMKTMLIAMLWFSTFPVRVKLSTYLLTDD